MNRYTVQNQIGQGSFGDVYLAVKKDTGEKCAVKRLVGVFSWERLMGLRELQCMARLKPHPNIVRMMEVIRCENDWGFFVFEFMSGGDLLQWKERHEKNGTAPADSEIRSILQQILRGLKHMHANGIYHRDLKPENILLEGRFCKIADFSLARPKDELEAVTEYVSTRWYRAPEIALGCPTYAEPVDLFALGAIAVELYTLKVLFPANCELQLLSMMFAFLGSPEAAGWKEGARMLRESPINVPQHPVNVFRSVQSRLPAPHNQKTATIDVLVNLLRLNPAKRITAAQALDHPFFVGIHAEEMVRQPAAAIGTTTIIVNATKPSDGVSVDDSDGDCSSSRGTPSANELLQPANTVTISPALHKKNQSRHQSSLAATKLPFPDNTPPPIKNPYSGNNTASTNKRQKTSLS